MSNILLPNEAIWVNTPTLLHELIDQLTHEPVVAVDTESDSLYSYFEKVCLLQFSTPQADYLVDPLQIDISALAPIFANPAPQKVFHAAEYDVMCLKRDYYFTFNNLFDTMLAARILGWEQYGLGPILAKYFDVILNKRFQRYNWGQRPLDKPAINYARLDTHYLLDLQQIQLTELQQRKRLSQALDVFKRLEHVEPSLKTFDPNGFWRVPDVRQLQHQEQAIARELFILRDQIAREFDVPLFKVWHNDILIHLARQKPRQPEELQAIKGIHPKALQHHTHHILRAIQTGLTTSPPIYPRQHRHRPDLAATNRYEALRSWRNGLAAERGMEPDVIMDNQALREIANRNPSNIVSLTKVGVLTTWQIEAYGEAMLKVLQNLELSSPN